MTTMGQYCKAYYVKQLSTYPAWRPNLTQLRPDVTEVDGRDVETPRTTLRDEDILYVQENLVVTDGIFLDEHVVFDALTPEWEEFCRGTLGFEIPADLTDDTTPPEVIEVAPEGLMNEGTTA